MTTTPDSPAPATPGVLAHITVGDGVKAIAFYEDAFGARELYRMLTPDGKRILHAELLLNGARLMLCDDFPEFCGGTARTATALGGTPVTLHLQVPDADALFARATDAGAEPIMPVAEMFWGDRYGKLRDPFGLEWSVGTKVREVGQEEMDKAVAAMFTPAEPTSPA